MASKKEIENKVLGMYGREYKSSPQPCLVIKYINELPRWANWWPMKWLYCKVRGIDSVISEQEPGLLELPEYAEIDLSYEKMKAKGETGDMTEKQWNNVLDKMDKVLFGGGDEG